MYAIDRERRAFRCAECGHVKLNLRGPGLTIAIDFGPFRALKPG